MKKKPKKPAKTTGRKPNAKTRAWYDAHPPQVVSAKPRPDMQTFIGGVYNTGAVTTSSRTQPPKPPVKAARVKRPRDTDSMRVYLKNILVTGLGLMDSSEARRRAAWLTHAAAYLEQEARRGK